MEKFEFKSSGGDEKKVTLNPHNLDRVIGRFKKEVSSHKYVIARHKLTKILGLLLQDNIPKIYRSSTSPHEIEMERKDWDKDHAKIQNLGILSYFVNIGRIDKKFHNDPKVKAFLTKISKIVSGDKNFIDLSAPHNYTRDEDNNPVYLDSFEPWSYDKDKKPNKLSFDPKLLQEEINKLPEKEKRAALSSFNRLMTLWSEEQSAFARNKNRIFKTF